jgi:glucose uptake protein GlcU
MHLLGASVSGITDTSEWPFILAIVLVGVIATALVLWMVVFFGRRAPRQHKAKGAAERVQSRGVTSAGEAEEREARR